MFCGYGVLVNTLGDHLEALPLPCKRWSCELCQPRRRAALLGLAASGEPNKVLTLTANPREGETPSDRLTQLHDAWRKLKKRVMRKYRWKKLPYMAFVEATKRGEPHLHILLRCDFIHQRWLSNQMRELANAPIVDIRQIKNPRKAIYYVAKYVTKAPAQFGSHKRYWYSQDYPIGVGDTLKEEMKDDRGYRYEHQRMEELCENQRARGYWPVKLANGWYRFLSVAEWHATAEAALNAYPAADDG